MRYAAIVPMLVVCAAQAQNVGVNPTGAAPDASAMLDVSATDRGLLVPRIALTAANVAAPVTTPSASLLVYNTATAGAAPNNVTPGYYYWSGAPANRWIRFAADGDAWRTTGNAGTAAGTNFIGTTDAVDFVVKTGGAAAANERMRVLGGGKVVVNNVGVGTNTNDVFSVYSDGTTNGTTGNTSAQGNRAIAGYTSAGYGVVGLTSSTANTTAGVYASSTAGTGTAYALRADKAALNGLTILGMANSTAGVTPTGTNSIAIQGQGNGTLTGTARSIGVLGLTGMTTGNATGVQGQSASTAGTGVLGLATTATAGGQPVGVFGQATSATGFGGIFDNNHANGTGMLGVGDNVGGFYLVDGSGGAFTGFETGSYHYNSTAGDGEGALMQDAFGAQWNVGAYAGLYYKIIGNGLVATLVKDLEERSVVMVCPEAPEALFQDYGTGKLVNGRATILLDPVLSKNIIVDDAHPIKVFVQLEGACNGVYVSNKSVLGFDVVELQDGTSDVPFSWSIVAHRAGETMTGPGGTRTIDYLGRFRSAPPYKSHMSTGEMERTALPAH